MTVDEQPKRGVRDGVNRDGFAAMAMLVLTVVFIVVVLTALI